MKIQTITLVRRWVSRQWAKPWVRRLTWGLAGFVVIFLIGINIAIAMTDVDSLAKPVDQPTIIYDRYGRVASKIMMSNREGVKFRQIPPYLIHAVIATEDRRFYEHGGVDYIGTLRALWVNLLSGKTVQGGSTLTQQLAKNEFLTQDRTLERKLKEFLYAKKIERTYSKNQILEMYLNRIYFGEGAWGIKQAARTYFGKDVSQLTLGESAMLAGMIKAPSALSPYKHFNQAMERRNVVLRLMKDQGYITEQQMKQAENQDIVLERKKRDPYNGKYPWYVDAIIQEAISKYGLTANEVLHGGLRIYTELDPRMQRVAETVYNDDSLFPQSKADQLIQSGAVLLDPSTGGIRALVGGRGEHVFRGFNHATQLKRQPGSALKPLAVYTPALEQGWQIGSVLKDEPMDFGGYRPQNHDGHYLGRLTMYEAVIDSANVPAVWLLQQIGIDKGIGALERFEIPITKEDRQLGLALGGLREGTSPLRMAQAYSVFPNNGLMVEAHTIRKIETADGEQLGRWYKKVTRVTSKKVAQSITYMLRGVVLEGTGKQARIPGREVAGKTGTTQMPGMNDGNKDNWFVGYTPQLVGAVWLGYDKTDAQHFLRTAAGDSAAIIFREMMSRALAGQPAQAFRLDTVHLSKPPKIDRSPKPQPKPQTPEEKAAKKIKEGLKDLWKQEEKRIKESLKKKKHEWEKRLQEWRLH
ncbi:transglycosylase domain-containing protein [Polycladomyces subterraneus]|uniref:Penicillin-binding protein 1A n=1 Tax=Polycladomyces subterraneus TaxID=1016997 RepID=A0ABT8IKR9_9BACL|nr:penicillin-binding protein 1A [Polycladomyces subterraneus]MDN4593385.1 penicillin-binding protein 1A [Polycladomyces subterraneus]